MLHLFNFAVMDIWFSSCRLSACYKEYINIFFRSNWTLYASCWGSRTVARILSQLPHPYLQQQHLTVGQLFLTANMPQNLSVGIGITLVKCTSLWASNNLPRDPVLNACEVLPVAPPPPPRQLTEEETQRLDEQEEDTLRELRLFLRDVTNRLSQDKRFKAFTKPVDLEEVVVLIISHCLIYCYFLRKTYLKQTYWELCLYSVGFVVLLSSIIPSNSNYLVLCFRYQITLM